MNRVDEEEKNDEVEVTIHLTLVHEATGESIERVPFVVTTSSRSSSSRSSSSSTIRSRALLAQVQQVSQDLFQLASVPQLLKDGRPLQLETTDEWRLQDDDVIAVRSSSSSFSSSQSSLSMPPPSHVLATTTTTNPSTTTTSTTTASTGGLDFSNLLAAASTSTTTTTTTSVSGNLYPQQPVAPASAIYYANMNLNEAISYNPRPETFITLLQSKEHLQKELNYYDPDLANKLRGLDHAAAVKIWREELVRGGIAKAYEATHQQQQRQRMLDKQRTHPHDPSVVEYFASIRNREKVADQYQQMIQEYPESLGRVLMLYIAVHINHHAIAAFCDTGAQSTIMSKQVARSVGLLEYVDTRFAGTAVGVGTGKIYGRIHIVQLQVGPDHYFPCSVTVMDDPAPGTSEMPFLLGLDMMKRHQCIIDLGQGVLKFRLTASGGAGGNAHANAPDPNNHDKYGGYLEAPFLHEKDLSEEQGGTQGYDADADNQKNRPLQEKE